MMSLFNYNDQSPHAHKRDENKHDKTGLRVPTGTPLMHTNHDKNATQNNYFMTCLLFWESQEKVGTLKMGFEAALISDPDTE